jgi:hypothetical protein
MTLACAQLTKPANVLIFMVIEVFIICRRGNLEVAKVRHFEIWMVGSCFTVYPSNANKSVFISHHQELPGLLVLGMLCLLPGWLFLSPPPSTQLPSPLAVFGSPGASSFRYCLCFHPLHGYTFLSLITGAPHTFLTALALQPLSSFIALVSVLPVLGQTDSDLCTPLSQLSVLRVRH